MIKAFVVDNDRLRAVDDFAANQGRSRLGRPVRRRPRKKRPPIEELDRRRHSDREEMEEIEISSRLYVENGAYFMTATLPAQADGDEPDDVAGHLRAGRHQADHRALPRAARLPDLSACAPRRSTPAARSGETILIGLLEAIVDRLADVLERASRDVVDDLARHLPPVREEGVEARPRFPARAAAHRPQGRPRLQDPGQPDDACSACPASSPMPRIQNKNGKDMRARIKTLSRDVLSLTDHAIVPVAEDHLPARRDARHDQHRAERHHQDRLGRRRRVPAADAGRLDLRHEFRTSCPN